MMDACENTLRHGLSFERGMLDEGDLGGHVGTLLVDLALPMAGLFGFAMIACLAAPALLGSLGFRAKAFAPKPAKINPASGLKRMFGDAWTCRTVEIDCQGGAAGDDRLLSDIIEYRLGGWTGGHVAQRRRIADRLEHHFGDRGDDRPARFLIALVDVPVQAMRRTKKLRMTKQEVKDENKQSEGSPEVKMAQRQQRQQVLSRSARQAVKEATVILTNPTHFAVALQLTGRVRTTRRPSSARAAMKWPTRSASWPPKTRCRCCLIRS